MAFSGKGCVLIDYGFTVVNRHHDLLSYKGQYLIGAGLQVQRFSPLSPRQYPGRHGTGGAGSSMSSSKGC